MFYRIQTFYLFISILVSSISLHFYPFYPYSKKNIKPSFFLLDRFILIVIITCLILSILSFLFFQKKKLQIFINGLNIFLNSTTFILILIFSCFQSNKYFLLSRKTNLFLTFLSICFLYLSSKKIKKDIKLIHSMNRIR
ncbi:conserved hypothetical protein [Blattabacterium sp. (Periplaneta americana) str. BPLAN]|uniref:DUF4293 family protein n=1 Tax=Blattabacterium sp. (Periplaneta americana) TaxID=367488 RepID=UPI0001BA0B6D|nr:DUF4293 family protein [Blattabacterium sp. (Periplaneta americana)]ACX83751.1 conserved hypothetical protein [Blattabacterium sp. (Periplaneta americana) str. BPLAN]